MGVISEVLSRCRACTLAALSERARVAGATMRADELLAQAWMAYDDQDSEGCGSDCACGECGGGDNEAASRSGDFRH